MGLLWAKITYPKCHFMASGFWFHTKDLSNEVLNIHLVKVSLWECHRWRCRLIHRKDMFYWIVNQSQPPHGSHWVPITMAIETFFKSFQGFLFLFLCFWKIAPIFAVVPRNLIHKSFMVCFISENYAFCITLRLLDWGS